MTAIDELEDYPLVGGDPEARVPSRSVLASLKPMGLGTPYRESLSSYYLALAHLHHLSPKTLAKELIVPKLEGGHAPLGDDSFTAWKLTLFNGIGAVPETWAKRLGDLTVRTDLIALTLVPLRAYTNMQRLTSGKKKWCPLCLFEAANEGRAYGQLLWEIAAVQACPRHGIKLVNQCGCRKSSRQSKRNVYRFPGYCGSCGCSLAHDRKESTESASCGEIARARLIAELLGDMERLKGKTDDGSVGVSMFLRSAVEHFSGGNAALFGRLLGIKKNTLHGWLHGKFVPTFPQMVEIAFSCRCSIADVMLGKQPAFKEPELVITHERPHKSLRKRTTRKLGKDLVKRQLQALAQGNPPISVAMAAAKIGVNRRTLFKNFGDIAKRINRRFQEYRHSEKARKLADRCDLYRQSAKRLMQGGIVPTPNRVGLNVRGKRVIIKGHERMTCSAICREVIQRGQGR